MLNVTWQQPFLKHSEKFYLSKNIDPHDFRPRKHENRN